MMTALKIEEHNKGFLRRLRRNRIRVEHRYFASTAPQQDPRGAPLL